MNNYRLDHTALPSVSKTAEGYLRGEAVMTRVGVFPYMNSDGSTRYELRHPDDVLSEASLETLKMLPVTVDHPAQMITADTAGDLQVGSTGETVRVDGPLIRGSLTISNQKGIAAVEAGRQALSLGYRLDLEAVSGEYDGIRYTHRQRNIRYNHLALVHEGRAGRAARLNMDGLVAVQINPEEESAMRKVNLDGIQYEAAPEVANALDRAVADVKTRTDELQAAVRRADGLQAKLDEAETKIKAAEKAAEVAKDQANKDFDELVKARVELLAAAQKHGVNVDSAKTARDIQVAVIKSRHSAFDDAGFSDDYITARFDAVIEAGAPNPQLVRTATTQPAARGDAADEEQAAFMKSVDTINAWRTQA